MNRTNRSQSFLATSQKKFLKVGFFVALAAVIGAFHIPMYVQAIIPEVYAAPPIENPIVTIVNFKKKVEVPPTAEVLPPPENPTIVVADPPELPEPEKKTIVEPTEITDPINMEPEIAPIDEKDDKIWEFPPGEMPQFPGGDMARLTYLSKIKYCTYALNEGIEGTVYVQFVVNKDGSISDVKALNSVDKCLDERAVTQVENMPKWTPGTFGLRSVSVRMTVPIKYTSKY